MDTTAVAEMASSETAATVVIPGPDQDSHASGAANEPDAAETEQLEDSKQSLWVHWLKVFRKKAENDRLKL